MPAYSVSYAKRCVPKISYLPEHVIHDRTQPIKPTGREPLTDELYWFFEGCDNGPARAPDAISLGTQTFLVRLVHYIQEVALEDEVDRLVAFVRVQVKSIAGRLDVERTPMVDEGRVIPTAHIRTHGMEKAPAPVRPQSEPLTRTLPHEINTVICAQLFDLYAGSTIVNATGRSAYSSNSHRWVCPALCRLCLLLIRSGRST